MFEGRRSRLAVAGVRVRLVWRSGALPARATVTVEGLSVNGASYLQEVKMKCPESEEFSEFTPNHHTVNDCLE